MGSRLPARLAALAGTGLVAFAFLLLAGVNGDDLRLKLGALRPLPSPDVAVGGFYSIAGDGGLAGPHCRLSPDALLRAVVRTESAVRLRNELGASLPVVAAWSAGLMGASGLEGLVAEKGDPARGERRWAGHTLRIGRVLRDALASTTAANEVIDASFERDPGCEATVRERYERGECVALVFRTARTPSVGLGYAFADETRCYVPFVERGPPNPPRYMPRAVRLTAWLSRVKDGLGLLDEEVADGAG